MATTSYLYHTLGLPSYHLEKTELREGAVCYHVRKKREARTVRSLSCRMDSSGRERQDHPDVSCAPCWAAQTQQGTAGSLLAFIGCYFLFFAFAD